MLIASFDMGVKNFACVVQRIDTHQIILCLYHETVSTIPMLIALLDQHANVWDQTSTILVEQQMKCNTKASKLGQQVLTYFHVLYGSFKTIIEFPSQKKTQMLGCPMSVRKTKGGRKKWCTEYARKLLQQRNDPWLPHFLRLAKQDDVADCICQIEAYNVICVSKQATKVLKFLKLPLASTLS